MINNAAIQYLNETQLTYIAKNSPQTPQHNASLEQANFTRYGMPDNNISVATKEFMSRNRLTKTPSERLWIELFDLFLEKFNFQTWTEK